MSLRRTTLAVSTLMLLLMIGAMFPLLGQGETIITVSVPSYLTSALPTDLFDDFEAQNPGAKVLLVPVENYYFGIGTLDLEQHLDDAQAYAQSADVLFVQSGSITSEAVRAGYFLDMTPLIEGNASFDVNDFYTPMLETFQWDRGTWAVPVVGSVTMFIYDRLAFDAAGLGYPNDSWTWDDFTNAARTLTQYDENGNPSVPGASVYSPGLLYYLFTGNTLYDSTQVPAPPMLNTPELATFMQEWQALNDEIIPETPGNYYPQIPLVFDSLWRLDDSIIFSGQENDVERDWQAALLPGGNASLNVTGLAISAGTEHPELAFAVIDALTRDSVFVNRISGESPARRSMVGVEPEDQSFIVRSSIPEEAQPLVELGLENAIPHSTLRFNEYVYTAVEAVETDNVDIATGLDEAQALAEENLAIAEERGQTTQVAVSTPVPTPIVGADQTVIRFRLDIYTSDIPNREGWNDLINTFLADHPNIGNIDLMAPTFAGPDQEPPEVDCSFSQTNNLAFPDYEVTDLLNLDPFMDADPNFDPNDFFGNVLSQVERDGMTYGYPMVLQPDIMWYDTAKFEAAGIPFPEGGWTIDAFVDALQSLAATSDSADAPFQPATSNANYLMMLAAAFGGIPYDYSTNPPTLNMTDPESVNALRQALDLARDGLIDFQELNAFGGGGGGFFGSEVPYAVTTDTFNSFSFRLQERNENDAFGGWNITTYPSGNQYTPVAFSLGVGYINAIARDPQACYDWLALVANNPQLLSGVPVKRSLINDPNVAQAQGEDVALMYQHFAGLLDSPNVVNFPGAFGGVSTYATYLEASWVNEIFNQYILEGADLETLMAQTQENIEAYRACTDSIEEPNFDENTTEEESMNYTRQFTDCVIAITPEFRENFPWVYGEDQ